MTNLTSFQPDDSLQVEHGSSTRSLCRIPSDPAVLAVLAERFRNADPFPHIVLDDVLTVAPDAIADSFPDPDWRAWGSWADSYQAGKRYCGNFSAMPRLMQDIIAELSQPAFLEFLERVSGIAALLPDPYLEGGGLHSSGTGGILTPHTDFHVLERLNLYRQINIILYLNPVWDQAWGGCLGLYRKGDQEPTQLVVPSFGRMVIFRTDHNSVHGFAVPVAEGRRRNSIALYYYTAQESATFSGDITTYWQQHGALSSAKGKAQMMVYSRLLGLSTFVSKVAYRLNPHVSRPSGKTKKT